MKFRYPIILIFSLTIMIPSLSLASPDEKGDIPKEEAQEEEKSEEEVEKKSVDLCYGFVKAKVVDEVLEVLGCSNPTSVTPPSKLADEFTYDAVVDKIIEENDYRMQPEAHKYEKDELVEDEDGVAIAEVGGLYIAYRDGCHGDDKIAEDADPEYLEHQLYEMGFFAHHFC